MFDKAGIVELASSLHELGWELLSSGGTANVISDADIPVVDVADYTGSPIMLGHRVVTLHPKIHGGILANRDDPEHQADLVANDINPIDLVVVNLYPFSERPGTEVIDIGGPTMVRAAAKNHAHVGVVVSPAAYDDVIEELSQVGSLSSDTRRRLARAAFAHTAAYDAAIVTWLDTSAAEPEILPPHHSSRPGARRRAALRREPTSARRSLPTIWSRQLVGRHHPTRWFADVVPQPVRRGRRLVAGT